MTSSEAFEQIAKRSFASIYLNFALFLIFLTFSSLKSFFPLGFLGFFSWIVLVCSGNNDRGTIKLGRLLNVESDGEVEFEKDCPK